MNAEAKNTPLPWAIRPNWDETEFDIYPLRDGPPDAGDWAEVAIVKSQWDDENEEAEHNAILIVRAVNSFHDMLDALKAAINISDDRLTGAGRTPECQAVYDLCAAAIAQAEGRL